MKRILFSLIAISSLLFMTTCDRVDYGDLNQNPNAGNEANVDALFRHAIARYFSQSGGSYLTAPIVLSQYESETVYTDVQTYTVYAGSWSVAYAYVLSNLKEITLVEEDIRGGTENIAAMAEILSVFVWKRLTDSYGDIPYSEALQKAENVTPAYDAQETIYKDLIARAKAARDQLGTEGAFAPDETIDILYGGDLDKWHKLANSLIMAISLQMSNKIPSTSGEAATAFQEALASGPIAENGDNLVFVPDPTGNVVNPFSGLRPADYALSQEFVDALKGVTTGLSPTSNSVYDNRIQRIANNVALSGLPYGHISYSSTSGWAQINTAITAASTSLHFFTSAYTYLLRAEAAAIGWTTEDAAAMLRSGIEHSYEQWNVGGADSYAGARVSDISTYGLERVIGEEKWVALFPEGVTAWAEQRRTGYPALLPAPDAVNGGVLPSRFMYPSEESTSNTANWERALSGLSPATDANTSKPWFMN
ncbi:SusD/RagB family nutrient-binding outer membrane lipoprotein [Olivibacter sitiensis]|uniref:SusD/RagB family nutrient-binding outer membrane lipoprotein n=1 Tax=Olivibacter sitiensis TaxID=376470 RepID=UPI00041DE2C4|nr:SusD/RagB family nutrient-binding outer membrane lipoprotein [Olivibacter sitiensis]